MSNIRIVALYKFADLPDYEKMQSPLLACCQKHEVKGTLLLAEEGINGTIAGSPEGMEAVLDKIRSWPELADIDHKESFSDENPFYRMKVRLKKEIVTIGIPDVNPNKMVGTYVEPKDWNEIISDPEMVILDTRNDYEVETGTFKNATDPHTTSFREFPAYVKENLDPKKHKKVAMFCTGGIRCEKASSYMLGEGFEEVYHLKGGILNYLEKVPSKESLWEGECFVFDNRVTVNHDLDPGEFDMCPSCRHPITEEDKASEKYELGVTCPYCYDNISDDRKKRSAQRQKQIELAKARGEKHIGQSIK